MGKRGSDILSLAVLLAASLVGQAAAQCADTRVDLRGPWGTARFSVEIADDSEERARGLMYRESMPASSGMLFVYARPQHVAFWMENTLIPLDMIFVDAGGRVLKVHENARPLDRTAIDGGDDVLAVLEINGGMAGRLGIQPGTELRHRVFGPGAAWPCD